MWSNVKNAYRVTRAGSRGTAMAVGFTQGAVRRFAVNYDAGLVLFHIVLQLIR